MIVKSALWGIVILGITSITGCGGGGGGGEETISSPQPTETIEDTSTATPTPQAAILEIVEIKSESVEVAEQEVVEATAVQTIASLQESKITIEEIKLPPITQDPPGAFPFAYIDALATKGSHGFRLGWGIAKNATHYQICQLDSDRSNNCRTVGELLSASNICSTKNCTSDIPLTLANYQNEKSTYFIIAYNNSDDGTSFTWSNQLDVSTETKLAARAFLKAFNSEEDQTFGTSVALSGDGKILAVGAPGDNGDYMSTLRNPNSNLYMSGAVFVFFQEETIWRLHSYINDFYTSEYDRFGTSVALSHDGRTLAIGTPDADGTNNNRQENIGSTTYDTGAVYIYGLRNTGYVNEWEDGESYPVYKENVWYLDGYLKASDATANDHFGHVISLSNDGKTVAVGTDVGSERNGVGRVYVFSYENQTWHQKAKLTASNTSYDWNLRDHARFGTSISLSGNGQTLAVGAPSEGGYLHKRVRNKQPQSQPDNELKSGAVYIFTPAVGQWKEQAYLKAKNFGMFDNFGTAISLNNDGNMLAIGAPGEDGDTNSTMASPNDLAQDSGAVYFFSRGDEQWDQSAYIKPTDNTQSHAMGTMLSITPDSNFLAVSSSNKIQLFTQQSGLWSLLSSWEHNDIITAWALSNNGQHLAVGNSEESTDLSGTIIKRNENADYSGAVLLY